MAAEAPVQLDRKLEKLYTNNGRPSIAPERLILSSLLQVLHTIRGKRLLLQQLEYHLLFRWFVRHSGITPRSARTGIDCWKRIARELFKAIVDQRGWRAGLLSDEHLGVSEFPCWRRVDLSSSDS